MNNILYLRPYSIRDNSCGLCNQLSFLINSILYCWKNNITNLIISDFVSDNTLLTKINICDLINLTETNNFLKQFNVKIIDSKLINLSSISNERIFNSNQFTSLDENWISSEYFFQIFNNISFNERYYKKANNLIPEIKLKLGEHVKINVIHLRLEIDALKHWGKINRIPLLKFKQLLEKKYINLIKTFINRSSFTIVMTYSGNNNVIKFLAANNYNFYINKKDLFQGRECNALIDLLLARKINNFFIGIYGSTFSNFILHSTNKKKTIMFDINNIFNPPSIIDY